MGQTRRYVNYEPEYVLEDNRLRPMSDEEKRALLPGSVLTNILFFNNEDPVENRYFDGQYWFLDMDPSADLELNYFPNTNNLNRTAYKLDMSKIEREHRVSLLQDTELRLGEQAERENREDSAAAHIALFTEALGRHLSRCGAAAGRKEQSP